MRRFGIVRWTVLARMAASLVAVLLLAALLMSSGCGGKGTEHLIPEDQLAREALSATLDAWKSGRKTEDELKLPQGTMIHVLDVDWRSGRKLESFEIGESVPAVGEEPRKFKVRIDCDGQDAKEVFYYVVGKEPLWVFRDADWKKTSGL